MLTILRPLYGKDTGLEMIVSIYIDLQAVTLAYVLSYFAHHIEKKSLPRLFACKNKYSTDREKRLLLTLKVFFLVTCKNIQIAKSFDLTH